MRHRKKRGTKIRKAVENRESRKSWLSSGKRNMLLLDRKVLQSTLAWGQHGGDLKKEKVRDHRGVSHHRKSNNTGPSKPVQRTAHGGRPPKEKEGSRKKEGSGRGFLSCRRTNLISNCARQKKRRRKGEKHWEKAYSFYQRRTLPIHHLEGQLHLREGVIRGGGNLQGSNSPGDPKKRKFPATRREGENGEGDIERDS